MTISSATVERMCTRSLFTILVNNVTGYFKIVPKSSKEAASWDGVLGNPVDGNTNLEGDIILADAQAMRVTEPGWVKITLNMMEYTYTIDIIGEMNLTLYVPGGHQGWNPATAPTLYSRNFDFKYDGFVYFYANTVFSLVGTAVGYNYGMRRWWTLLEGGGNKTRRVMYRRCEFSEVLLYMVKMSGADRRCY